MQRIIRIGTRGSRLARAQTDIVIDRLKKADPSLQIETVIITTTGDKDQKTSLKDIGGKGVFIREIEHALLDNTIDLAVHSFKDITCQTADGLRLAGFLKPESVCDVLISRNTMPFNDIPSGSTIGTGSMRRRVLLKRIRNDLKYVDIRGNIDTRIARLDEGVYDGIVLSEAGLIRLGLQDRISERFNPEWFIPAPGQGVIAVESRANDESLFRLCQDVFDKEQFLLSGAEFMVLEEIGFDCRMPFGMHSRIDKGILTMKAFYENPENGTYVEETATGSSSLPSEIAVQLVEKLLG
ncbi:MAG: hydroxymethylbilane synthase [Fibrobacter sp.]|nr:hydroxymethylbilane synthase [Fibrobacter sp.]